MAPAGTETSKYEDELRGLFQRAYAVSDELIKLESTRANLAAALATSPELLTDIYNNFALKLDTKWRQFNGGLMDNKDNIGAGGQLLASEKPAIVGADTEED